MILYSTILPPLSEQEFTALKSSIAKDGQQVPIMVDEDGNVLDGLHRERACRELGVEPRREVRSGLSEEQKREFALVQNAARRQLSAWGKAVALAALLEARGVERGSGANQGEQAETISACAAVFGVTDRTARNWLSLWDALADRPELAQELDAGRMTVGQAKELARPRGRKKVTADEKRSLVKPPKPLVELRELRTAIAASERAKAESDAIRSARGLDLVPESSVVTAWRRRLSEASAKANPSEEVQEIAARLRRVRAALPDGSPMNEPLVEAIAALRRALDAAPLAAASSNGGSP